MNASKLLISSVAALSVVGALSIANAQISSPGTGATTQMDNSRAPQDNGSEAPAPLDNAPTTTPSTTMDNAPVAADPMLPAQADRN